MYESKLNLKNRRAEEELSMYNKCRRVMIVPVGLFCKVCRISTLQFQEKIWTIKKLKDWNSWQAADIFLVPTSPADKGPPHMENKLSAWQVASLTVPSAEPSNRKRGQVLVPAREKKTSAPRVN